MVVKGGNSNMELGSQIKKYRDELSLSQDALAEKLYVSRQTISNWENDKSYPDVKSLLLLSEVFQTSVDNLIKGDVEIMREQVNAEDRRDFEKVGKVYVALLFTMIISFVPLIRFLKVVGVVIWVVIMLATVYAAIVVEKKKKQFDIQTYREIVAFSEGTRLDEMEKLKEDAKKPYQKVLLGILSGLIAIIVIAVLGALLI